MGQLGPSLPALAELCFARPSPTPLGTATVPPSGLSHTPSQVHTHPYPETSDTSVLELQCVLNILFSQTLPQENPEFLGARDGYATCMHASVHVCVCWGRSCTNTPASCLSGVRLRQNGVVRQDSSGLHQENQPEGGHRGKVRLNPKGRVPVNVQCLSESLNHTPSFSFFRKE